MRLLHKITWVLLARKLKIKLLE